ncbi:antibiotic biosynthesis monooxygenase [Ketogulonicigenium robustum]|uniref:Antibiotic biosynthesis monooxygenase n=1 Tax=Ketogulonicigenium robustum TaxID=92947 RepID=A0A1W6NZP8_9RHOB|nr:antibiotic biosynthesis monooxygenase [Ketogulonicigenium robustum]ARO14623.1 antibiotic biosynthesis monooxygenase [Ketogulonicigenium robustum]
MYIAMNRFIVQLENAEGFEAMWLGRESTLDQLPGFIEFHMLKGPEADDGTRLYASHTVWASEEDLKNWTRSDHFRAAHARRGEGDAPRVPVVTSKFEGFNAIQHIKAKA